MSSNYQLGTLNSL